MAQNKLGLYFSWETARYTLLRWLSYKVAKTEIGTIPPRWIRLLHCILFPLHGLYAKQTQVHYSMQFDCYTIRGVVISSSVLDAISHDAERNTVFKFIRNENGVVMLERQYQNEINNF